MTFEAPGHLETKVNCIHQIMDMNVVSLATSVVRSLVQGDLYKNWEKLLRVTHITDAKEGKEEKQKRIYVLNGLIVLWIAFCALRISVTGLMKSEEHVYGFIVLNVGNARYLLAATAVFIFVQTAFYRMGITRLVHEDGMFVWRFLRSIATCDPEVRQTKEQQSHVILIAGVVGIIGIWITAISLAVAVFAINVMHSKTDFEVICWSFWLPFDILMVLTAGVELVIFPCIWILVALNYRTDVSLLNEQIHEMKNQSNPIASTAIFREVYLTYFRLKAKADLTNRMSAPILWSLTFCTTPIVCLEALSLSTLTTGYFGWGSR